MNQYRRNPEKSFTWLHRPKRATLVAVVALAIFMNLPSVHATTTCSGGQGETCDFQAQCGYNEVATKCILDKNTGSTTCEIPCEDEDGNPKPSLCSLGETCKKGSLTESGTTIGSSYFCKTSPFTMDINLLDNCIKYFVDGLQVNLHSTNECSLTRNLSVMLDQDSNKVFNIYDVDLCIENFLHQQGCSCDGVPGTDDLYRQVHNGVYCTKNSDCELATCQTSEDCGAGYSCTEGKCECDGAECDNPMVCDPVYNYCRRGCQENADCATGYVCDDDFKCRKECHIDDDCSPGTSCNTETNFCVCDDPQCPTDSVERIFCAVDADCGAGLFCDPELHYCQRECGLIINRASASDNQALNRECGGMLKECQVTRGYCSTVVDVEEMLCSQDETCPSGAYCLMGRCAPECYSSIQCPDSNWYCSVNNRCRPVPVNGGEGDYFEPLDYSILFGQRNIALDSTNEAVKVPLIIMNKLTRKQVFNEPNVVFGYRLETEYHLKEEAKCKQDFAALFEEEKKRCADDWTGYADSQDCVDYWNAQGLEIIADCKISDHEEFITLENPFGIVYGAGKPSIDLRLNTGIADKLSPGLYKVTVRAIFNNMDSDEFTITFQKPSPNGDYTGFLHIYKGGPENSLGIQNLKMKLHIDTDANQVMWDDLLKVNNLYEEKEYEDITQGYPITGYIDGNSSLSFNLPGATNQKDNRIPIKGIYAAHLGRIRLLSVIDIEPDACWSENGACDASGNDPNHLELTNVFGRKIRRIVEFMGPFDFRNRKISGLRRSENGGGYRETISGLLPAGRDVTLEGEFELAQSAQNDDEIVLGKLLDKNEAVSFPGRYELLQLVEENIRKKDTCAGFSEETKAFRNERNFDNYMDLFDAVAHTSEAGDPDAEAWQMSMGGAIFRDMIRFEGEIGRALDDLEYSQADYLTLSEYLKGTILFCSQDGADRETCVDQEKARCGLVLYQKALLSLRSQFDVTEDECIVDGDCPRGFYCEGEENFCQQDACDSDEECDDGLFCNTGRHLCECDEDADCGENAVCEPGTRTCMELSRGWVDLQSVGNIDGFNSFTLFCPENPLSGSDCLLPASEENRALIAMQEHNRFFKELVQTLSYQAGNDLSDAFYVLYKAHQGDELDADSAFSHKMLKLRSALKNYEEMRKVFYSPQTTAVMFYWPMRLFGGMGETWLQYMNTATKDRLDTLIDLIDLRRRMLQDTNEQDYAFVQNMLQEEYLTHVFLFLLQEEWQKELFTYTGGAEDLFVQGNLLLSKVDEGRNPLGFHPNRIYFENSDLSLNNWQNYRKRVEEELVKADEAVAGAINQMRGALNDRDTLENSLRGSADTFDSQIQQLCGSGEPMPEGCSLSLAERARILKDKCEGESCLFAWKCNGGECERVKKYFEDNIPELNAENEVMCRVDSTPWTIDVNNTERLCIRGQMGNLMQEGVMLDMQREQVYDKVQALIRQLAEQRDYVNLIYGKYKSRPALENPYMDEVVDESILAYLGTYNTEMETIRRSLLSSEQEYDRLMAFADAAHITLTITGGDVAGRVAKLGLQVAANEIKYGSQRDDLKDRARLEREKEIEFLKDKFQKEREQLELTESIWDDNQSVASSDFEREKTRFIESELLSLENMSAQIENYVNEYELLVQQSYNNKLRVADTLFLAEQAAARYCEAVSSVVDRLIGRESGSVLLRNKMVKEANARFQDVILETYKMAQAFIHRYNIGSAATNITNKVYQLQTLKDVRSFIEELTDLETDYCGKNGLDCDYKHNQKIFRLSLRDSLFPHFQDQPNPDGSVTTKGQLFHNAITSYPYLQRTKRSSGMRSLIKLPINIPLTKGGGIGAANHYLINPEECNHFIVGQRNGGMAAAGTIAVNVVGTRLTEDVEYELWRNNTDYLRSCTEKVEENEQAINVFTVGWAPQSDSARMDEPESFLTHSTSFAACKNNWKLDDVNLRNNEDSCFNFFARDRSLGTMDMSLVIPFVDDEQNWVFGFGKPFGSEPIIEDIVIYIRYNSQPIYSDGN